MKNVIKLIKNLWSKEPFDQTIGLEFGILDIMVTFGLVLLILILLLK